MYIAAWHACMAPETRLACFEDLQQCLRLALVFTRCSKTCVQACYISEIDQAHVDCCALTALQGSHQHVSRSAATIQTVCACHNNVQESLSMVMMQAAADLVVLISGRPSIHGKLRLLSQRFELLSKVLLGCDSICSTRDQQ